MKMNDKRLLMGKDDGRDCGSQKEEAGAAMPYY